MPALDRADDDEPFAASRHGDVSAELLLLDRMVRFRREPLQWMHEIALYVSGSGWRSYDNVVGQPCFYAGYTEKIRNTVLRSPILNAKIRLLTDTKLEREESEGLLAVADLGKSKAERREVIENSIIGIVNSMIDDMMCKMESKGFIRTAFYFTTQLLTRAYSGVYVSKPEVERLRSIATIAAAKKQSIIFLPRHSSHIDYVTLHLICYRLGLTLPVVVAGDNLNFPAVGNFLQSAGAMWIRRKFDAVNDPLYSTTVQAYLDSLLLEGHNVECFIEGTRSRTGKLLNPKFGILSFLLDSVLSGRIPDAYICPVSLQYDKVIEVDSYVSELMGTPKQRENLTDFLSASSLLRLNFGRIDCRFHEPWSLRDFIDQQASRQPDSPSSPGSSIDVEAFRPRLIRTLGYRVLSDINKVSVVMPSALVGTVLLTLRGRGVGIAELVRRVDWLCERVRAKEGQVADFHGMPTQYVVERALEVLGPDLVGVVHGLAEQTYFAADRFQLSFYRNMVIHLFISEALVAASLYTKVKQGGSSHDQRLTRVQLTSKVNFLSQLFRGEFIFPAGQGLEYNLKKAMNGLIASNTLGVTQSSPDHDEIGLTDEERRNGRENFDFYCFLIFPFCDAAWLGAVSLLCLVPPHAVSDAHVDLNLALKCAQLLGRTLYHQGELSYFEAINSQALRNAYTRLEEEEIIVISKPKDSKAPTLVRISDDWMPTRSSTGDILPEGRLWDFISRISEYRREGKGRHDSATVSKRVIPLTSEIGKDLFVGAGQSASQASAPNSHGPRSKRRTKL